MNISINKFNIIVIIFIFLCVYLLAYNNTKIENFDNTTEAIANVASLYKTGNFSATNMRITNNLDVSGNMTVSGKLNVINDINVGNNLNITKNLSVSGSFNYLPTGMITMWKGVTPPNGWALCDGTNGTPDLRGRFIMGYDASATSTSYDSYASSIGLIGGSKNLYAGTGFFWAGGDPYNWTWMSNKNINSLLNSSYNNSGKHFSEFKDVSGTKEIKFDTPIQNFDTNEIHLKGGAAYSSSMTTFNLSKPSMIIGDADYNTTLPPYYVLAFIMKL